MNNLSGIGNTDFYQGENNTTLATLHGVPTIQELPEFFKNKKSWLIAGLGLVLLFFLFKRKGLTILKNPMLKHGFTGEDNVWAYRVVRKFDVYLHLSVGKTSKGFRAYITMKDPVGRIGLRDCLVVNKEFKTFDKALDWLEEQLIDESTLNKVKVLKKDLYNKEEWRKR